MRRIMSATNGFVQRATPTLTAAVAAVLISLLAPILCLAHVTSGDDAAPGDTHERLQHRERCS